MAERLRGTQGVEILNDVVLNQEKVGPVATNDDRRTDFAAGQIREGNREQDDIIS